MIEIIRRTVSDSLQLKKSFFSANEEQVAALAGEVCRALESGRKVVLFGNGGSAADAQHIAAELVGRFQEDRRPLAALALTTDTSILTSIGNDFGFEQVFVRQIRALGREGDVCIAISTSGNSPNVVLAARAAAEMGMVLAAFTGSDGGELGSLARYHLNVPHSSTARVQEIHIMIGHIICDLVDQQLKGS